MKNNPTEKSPFSNLMQIGVVVRDLKGVARLLSSLGIGLFESSSPPPGAEGLYYHGKLVDSEFKAARARMGNMELELLQPGKGESPWREFLDNKGEGVQHLGFYVDDVETAVAKLVEKGASVMVTGKIRGRLAAAYLDLGAANIIVELMQLE